MVSSLQSEYEQSFRPFAGYRENVINKGNGDWISELHETRRRAAENKIRSRGDHFSPDHLLQIPSQSTRFWEPLGTPYSLSPNAAFSDNERVLDASEYPDEGLMTNQEMPNVNLVSRDHRSVIWDDQRPEVVLPVGHKMDRHSQLNIDHPVTYAVSKQSRATQTSPSTENIPRGPAGIVQTGSTVKNEVGLVQRQPTDVVGASPNNVTRLEILRKAKYFDVKDFASSTALTRSVARSLSTRSLNRSGDRKSGFCPSPIQNDRRPDSSPVVFSKNSQKARASSGNLRLYEGRANSSTERVPDQPFTQDLNYKRRGSPVNSKPSTFPTNTVLQRQTMPAKESMKTKDVKEEGVRSYSGKDSPACRSSNGHFENPSHGREFSQVHDCRKLSIKGRSHFCAWIEL